MDLYILAGQSNMSGRGRAEPDEGSDLSGVKKRQLLALDANCVWNVAQGGVYTYENYPDHMTFINPEKVGLGPGLRFAERVAEEIEGSSEIGLIPTAVGGSNIKQWHPDTGKLYKEAIRRTREAQKRGSVRALLWHQGESDATESNCSEYAERLREVIAGFRRDLNAPDLLVLVGTLGKFLDDHFAKQMFGHWRIVNEQIRDVAKKDDRVYLVEAENLTSAGDNLHFSSDSAQRLGERYFEEYIRARMEVGTKDVDSSTVNAKSVLEEDEIRTVQSPQTKAACCKKADGMSDLLPGGGFYYIAGAVVFSGSLAYAALSGGSLI